MIKPTSFSLGSLLVKYSTLADIDVYFGDFSRRLHSCVLRARVPRLGRKPKVAQKLRQATHLTSNGIDLALRYIYCDDLPGEAFLTEANQDALTVTRCACDAMVRSWRHSTLFSSTPETISFW